jgi:hypothetical protein
MGRESETGRGGRRLSKAFALSPRSEIRRRLAKSLAAKRGHYGAHGGWIYSPEHRPIAQGWDSYYLKLRASIWREVIGDEADALVARARNRERAIERGVWGVGGRV